MSESDTTAGAGGRVLLFTGHMIDAPDRPPEKARFPPEKEPVAREAIRQAVSHELKLSPGGARGLTDASSGGGILFHEVCAELNVPTTLYLPLPRDEFVEKSVRPAGPEWERRFDRLYETLPRREMTEATLPAWLREREDYNVWQRSNLWMLSEALEQGGDKVTLIALWDGGAGDGPGGTEDMVKRARERGARTVILDTKTLFGL